MIDMLFCVILGIIAIMAAILLLAFAVVALVLYINEKG